MKLAKWFSGLAIVFLLLSLVVTVGAAPSTSDVVTASTIVNSGEITGAARPSGGGGGDKIPPVVEILAPADGATVSGTGVLIRATATGASGIKKVEYGVDSAGWTLMAKAGDGTYQATWDSTTVADGSHTITVRATDNRNNKGYDSVTVTTQDAIEPPPPTAQYELFIEIDYIAGHDPTQTVLDYIEWYYMGNNPSGDLIKVTFSVQPAILPQGVDTADGISESEFWAIEAVSNAGADNADGNRNNGKYYSKDKWVLYGTSVEGYSNVVGYCYVVLQGFMQQDCVAGNYIFIADEVADSIEDYGAEAVVLMHEMGHSIGIGKFRLNQEIYDTDSSSVMSYLSATNATLYGGWYYSAQYWDTRNLGYYSVS